jgi:hypothetical protein
MQTLPGHTTAYRRTFEPEPQPLTPAERIALTIALLNRGLDLVDGFARTALASRTRGIGRHRWPTRVSR